MKRLTLSLMSLLTPLPVLAISHPSTLTGSATETSVTVSWPAVEGATGYSVWVPNPDGSYGFRWMKVQTTSSTSVTFEDVVRKIQIMVTTEPAEGATGVPPQIFIGPLRTETVTRDLLPARCRSLANGCWVSTTEGEAVLAAAGVLRPSDSFLSFVEHCQPTAAFNYQQFGPNPTGSEQTPFSLDVQCSGQATNGQRYTQTLNESGYVYFVSGRRGGLFYHIDSGSVVFTPVVSSAAP